MLEKLIPVSQISSGDSPIFIPDPQAGFIKAKQIAVLNPQLCSGCSEASKLQKGTLERSGVATPVSTCTTPLETRIRKCKIYPGN